MRDALVIRLLSWLPRKAVARWMGALARTGLSRLGTRLFVRVYGVDLSEAAEPIEAYGSLEALFTRALRPGVRPIDPAPEALVSPADGHVAWVGASREGRIEVAPGREVSVEGLVGEALAPQVALVIYLSPTDYHRVHVPREGRARRWRYLPGTLWPVFPAAVERIDGLFARNERLSICATTAAGELYTVLIGAFGVGRISCRLCDLQSNTGAPATVGEVEVPLERGEELGVFHLGSTVVLLAGQGAVQWEVRAGDRVRVGQRVGRLA